MLSVLDAERGSMKNFKRLYEQDNSHPGGSGRAEVAEDDAVAEGEGAAEMNYQM
jgi:hypothetical protein